MPEAPADVLRFADLTFDLGSMDARRGGRRFELTTTEAHLLELFMRNPRQVLPRSLIYERVWGYDFSHSSNALDVYVGYLRRKTEADERAAPDPHRPRHGLRPARAMSLRARLTLVAAGVVAVVVALASMTTYFVMRHELYSQVDSELCACAQRNPSSAFGGPQPATRRLRQRRRLPGSVCERRATSRSTARYSEVARGRAHGFFRDARRRCQDASSRDAARASSRRLLGAAPSSSPRTSTTSTASSTGCD